MTTDFILFSNSTDNVTLLPEFNDFKDTTEKLQSVGRSTTGDSYIYFFGTRKGIEMTVKYLNSADMTLVNSWWQASIPLKLLEGSSESVEMRIMNREAPINKRVKPYTDLFMGKLMLEQL